MSSETDVDECKHINEDGTYEKHVIIKGGMLTCTLCGLVLGPTYRPSRDFPNTHFRYEPEGFKPVIPKFYKGFSKKLARLNKHQYRINNQTHNRQERMILLYLSELRVHMRISKIVEQSAFKFFKKEKKRKKISNIYHFIVVLVFGFGRMYGEPYKITELIKIVKQTGHGHGFKKGTFNKYIERMNNQYNDIFKRKYEPEVLLTNLISIVTESLEVSNKFSSKQAKELYRIVLFKRAREIMKKFHGKDKRGKNIIAEFLTYIYLADREMNEKDKQKKYITQRLVAEISGFSQLTIRQHMGYIENPLS